MLTCSFDENILKNVQQVQKPAKGIRTTLKMPGKQQRRAKYSNSEVGVSLVCQDHPSFSTNRGFKACYAAYQRDYHDSGHVLCRCKPDTAELTPMSVLYMLLISLNTLRSSSKRLSTRSKGFMLLRRKPSLTRSRLRTAHTFSFQVLNLHNIFFAFIMPLQMNIRSKDFP